MSESYIKVLYGMKRVQNNNENKTICEYFRKNFLAMINLKQQHFEKKTNRKKIPQHKLWKFFYGHKPLEKTFYLSTFCTLL